MRKTTIALLTSAALIAVGCGSAPTDTGPEPVTTEAVPTPGVKPTTNAKGLGAGVWQVPGEAKPGTYTTTAGESCYWARLSSFDGELSSIIANNNIDAGARGRLTVKKTDKGLQLDGPCVWVKAK